MLKQNQKVYFLSQYDYSIKTAIYKGEIHICPYKTVYNLYRDEYDEIEKGSNETNNFLINPDFVFDNEEEAKEFQRDFIEV